MNSSQPPFTITLCCSGKAGAEITSEAEPGMKRKAGGKCFKVLFYFSLPYSDLIELISLSWAWFACEGDWPLPGKQGYV